MYNPSTADRLRAEVVRIARKRVNVIIINRAYNDVYYRIQTLMANRMWNIQVPLSHVIGRADVVFYE